MNEALIFDMDGVLVDSEPCYKEIDKRQFLQYGISVAEEEHQKYLGVASEVMWRELAQRHKIAIPEEELIERYNRECIRYFAEMEVIPVMPGLVELLEKLQARGIPLAVASSSTPEIIDLLLSRAGLKKYFRVLVSAEEAGKSKPNPDVFLLAAQKLGVEPGLCLVIEDSANGIKAAKAAGMRCVAYQSPGITEMNWNGADAVITSYSRLEELI